MSRGNEYRLLACGNIVVCFLALTLIGPELSAGEEHDSSRPWWKKEKIRFFWGDWHAMDEAGIPIEVTMKNLARVGATIFAENQHAGGDRGLVWEGAVTYSHRTARAAHEHRIRYFASAWASGVSGFADQVKARLSMDRSGNPYKGRVQGDVCPCPLNKPFYAQCFIDPVVKLAKAGLADGLHLDWERYVGRGEAGTCYCDDCFKTFLKIQGKGGDLPKPEQRGKWLDENNLGGEYNGTYDRRRRELFRWIEQRVHEVAPTFVFAGYYITHYAPYIAESLHTPEVPFFVVDDRHYYESHTRPWWESLDQHFRNQGYLRIAGSYDMTFLGGEPASEVSFSQWMYDAAIHSDGVWPYFEQELTPDAWRAFAIADRRIRATEARVGNYLLDGERDPHFMTPVVWSGSPQLRRKVKHVSYHLGDNHLVHVNNVDADRPVKLRLRFPRISADDSWTVRDPMSGLYYSPDAEAAVWDAAHLAEGIVISLEKRSELFLLLSPKSGKLSAPRSHLIASELMRPLADHPKTEPGVVQPVATGGRQRLAYLVTQQLGFRGSMGRWAIGNAIYSINADGQDNKRHFGLKGYLWEPEWSPDGTRIAFSCYSNGRGQIFVMGADGSALANVSSNAHCDRSPAWSPDGKRIAFVSDRDGDWEIYVMNADGSAQARLTSSPGVDDNPVWSPSCTRIAFESNRRGDLDIFIINADGTSERNLTAMPGNEMDPAWSPDGKSIACSGTENRTRRVLLVVNAEGAKRIAVRYAGHYESICWSPDGKHVAAVVDGGVLVLDPAEAHGVHISDAMKMSKASVSAEPVKPHPIRWKPKLSWYSLGSASPRWVPRTFGGLAWSPDSSRLAFSADMDDGFFYVYITSIEEGKPKRLDQTKSAWVQEISWCPK